MAINRAKSVVEDMGLSIYTAGPIDLGKDIPNWRARLAEEFKLINFDAVLFDPSTSYKLSQFGTQADRRDDYIEQVNANALELADVMVVCLPQGSQSIGTPIEIDMAHRQNKRVLLITDIPRGKSVYLNNRIDQDNWFMCTDLRNPALLTDVLLRVVHALTGVIGG